MVLFYSLLVWKMAMCLEVVVVVVVQKNVGNCHWFSCRFCSNFLFFILLIYISNGCVSLLTFSFKVFGTRKCSSWGNSVYNVVTFPFPPIVFVFRFHSAEMRTVPNAVGWCSAHLKTHPSLEESKSPRINGDSFGCRNQLLLQAARAAAISWKDLRKAGKVCCAY